MSRLSAIVLCLLLLATRGFANETYTVVSGDTLSKIAKVYYHDANAYHRIFDANRDKVRSANLIFPGTVLVIPAVSLHTSVSVSVKPLVAPQTLSPVVTSQDARAQRIDAYFAAHKMPLAGLGSVFVEEADRNQIDWRLLAAISVKESFGGKHQLSGFHNPFGWASGLVHFSSYKHAISLISQRLGFGRYYKGKTTYQKIRTYNPPSVEPLYADRVFAIMQDISRE